MTVGQTFAMMPHGIYPESMANNLKAHAGEKYRPSNGTEGHYFFAEWCCQCARDKAMREGCEVADCDDNERCDIIVETLVYAVDAPEYPTAWQYGPDGQPCCTAFVPAGTVIQPSAEELERAGQMRLIP